METHLDDATRSTPPVTHDPAAYPALPSVPRGRPTVDSTSTPHLLLPADHEFYARGVFVAMSAMPHAGLGLHAGNSFAGGEVIMCMARPTHVRSARDARAWTYAHDLPDSVALRMNFKSYFLDEAVQEHRGSFAYCQWRAANDAWELPCNVAWQLFRVKRPRGSSWHLVPALVALRPLREGEEVIYDYSDTSYRRMLPSPASTAAGLVESDSPWVNQVLDELELGCSETIAPTTSSPPLSPCSVSEDSLLDELEDGEVDEGSSSPARTSMAMVARAVSEDTQSNVPTNCAGPYAAPDSGAEQTVASTSTAQSRGRAGRRGSQRARARRASDTHVRALRQRSFNSRIYPRAWSPLPIPDRVHCRSDCVPPSPISSSRCMAANTNMLAWCLGMFPIVCHSIAIWMEFDTAGFLLLLRMLSVMAIAMAFSLALEHARQLKATTSPSQLPVGSLAPYFKYPNSGHCYGHAMSGGVAYPAAPVPKDIESVPRDYTDVVRTTAGAARSAGLPSRSVAKRVLILFAGPERADDIGSCLRLADVPVTEIDLVRGDDLLDKNTRNRLMAEVRAGVFGVVFAAPPCSTFSVARLQISTGPPQLRSRIHPKGIPGLSPHDQEQVDTHNRLVGVMLELMAADAKMGAFLAIENSVPRGDPASRFYQTGLSDHASFWDLPEVRAMMKGAYMISIDFPQCALRADFQKYTRLAFTYDLRPMLNRLSSLRCNHRTHVSIANGYDGHGRSLGQRSAMYPPAMSALLAQTFATAIFDKRAKEMQTVVAPAVRVDMPSDGLPTPVPAPRSPHALMKSMFIDTMAPYGVTSTPSSII